MDYTVKQSIPGFENVKKVIIENTDGTTCLLRSLDDNNYMQIALVHAQANANIDVSVEIQELLKLKDEVHLH